MKPSKPWKEPIHWPVGHSGKIQVDTPKPQRETVSGPDLWRRIHAYRWISYTEFKEWFTSWLSDVNKLPGCSCSKDFMTTILPQFADRFCKIKDDEEWFAVTVEIHNAVNAKLSKKIFSMEEAKQARK